MSNQEHGLTHGTMPRDERHALVRSYLGRTIRIEIDRSIGYVHRKSDRTLVYPVNYRYIPGVLGGDGEELDVYLLGVNTPKKEYTGRIIGIAYRDDDVEDKLIMAPIGTVFTQNEIAEAIEFQEKYYHGRIEALYQKSCGAVVWRRRGDSIEYLCLHQRRSGTWSVPKGHAEAHESELETAKRELSEEIGVRLSIAPDFRHEIDYPLPCGAHKTVALYLAEFCGNININTSEITEYAFFPLSSASDVLPPYYRQVLSDAEEKIGRC